MSSSSQRLGDQAERDVKAWFREHGSPDADRALGTGRPRDRGDLTGIARFCVQVKNYAQFRINTWVPEMLEQKRRLGAEFGVLLLKKRGTSDVGRWYTVMELEDLNRLRLEAEGQIDEKDRTIALYQQALDIAATEIERLKGSTAAIVVDGRQPE